MTQKRKKRKALRRVAVLIHPDKALDQRLVVFFYLLVRDHLPMGVVEHLIIEACKTVPNKEVLYSNRQLAEWATEKTNVLSTSLFAQ